MIDVAISVSFAAGLGVFLGWCLWRVCKVEINSRARTIPSDLIRTDQSGAAGVMPKEEMKAEEPLKAA